MSRAQCRFVYQQPLGGWHLYDGDGKKRSLNGTWVMIDDYCEVTHSMVIKSESAMILVSASQARINLTAK